MYYPTYQLSIKQATCHLEVDYQQNDPALPLAGRSVRTVMLGVSHWDGQARETQAPVQQADTVITLKRVVS